MIIKETYIKGCFIIEPKIYNDNRGYFFESYNSKLFNELTGLNLNFIQDNESYSTRGILRGLHYQKGKWAQAKLVRVIKGKVLDVAVDLRKDSQTFGEYVSLELSDINKKLFYIPRGFAHGFIVLSQDALFSYKCDNYYNKNSEEGIVYNDPILNIDWRLPNHEIVVSEKDINLPKFSNAQL